MDSLQQAIEQALNNLAKPNSDLKTDAIALFDALGYRSDKTETLSPPNAKGFQSTFRHKISDSISVPTGEWKRVELLFQLTGDEVNEQPSLMAGAFDEKRIDSFLFFAVELEKESYSRTALANIARELNKPFAASAPVIVLFRYGGMASLASLHRRENKRDSNRDVLDRVVLLKDIRLDQPHRAHFDILSALTLKGMRVHSWESFLAEWNRVLDLNTLNKSFFHELSKWYFWAVQNVEFPRPKTDARTLEEHRAMSVIRLITRLIFVWFIKERDLVPDTLFEREAVEKLLQSLDPKESSYYRAILQNLFFATLNTELGEQTRAWANDKSFEGHNDDFGVDKWRFPELFRPEALPQVEAMFRSVPFLNGGLFRRLDDGDKNEYFDGFTRRAQFQPKVPNFLFWGAEQKVDLNSEMGTKGREYMVRPLLSILKSYVFTVSENTPLEEEVALDPELLGKVFENLLASYNPETATTARKQTGSFYTPRPVVDYLVETSLFSQLRRGAPAISDTDLRLLLSPDKDAIPALSEDDKIALIAAIHGTRVLDPACGSGAFVMGALDAMVRLLRKLDSHNKRFYAEEKRKILSLSDRQARETALARMERIYNHDCADYLRKLVLIERCIHGVDIQPIAVQIAKLRIFISLAIEQEIDRQNPDNYGIESLPNLETKIVAANTLRSLEKPIQLDMFTSAKQDELREMVEEYFTCYRRARKKELETRVEALFKELGDHIEQTDKTHQTDAALIRKWKFWDQNVGAPFFDRGWMFGKGVSDGFDIIIGNPPYLRVQGIPAADATYYKKKFQSAKGAFDLYALFIERGYAMLSPDGTLGFIVPHKFFQAAFGESLRQQLTQARALRQIVRFGHAQVFTEATTYTCLLFLSRKPSEKFDLIEIERLDHAPQLFEALRSGGEHPELAIAKDEKGERGLPAPENTNWDFSLDESNKTLARLQQHPHMLGEFMKVFQGIATSGNHIYVLDFKERFTDKNGVKVVRCVQTIEKIETEVELEAAFVKPFLMGKDIHRYEPLKARKVVIFPYLIGEVDGQPKARIMAPEWIQKHCPRAWAYLIANKEEFEGREKGKMKRPDFYAYVYPKSLAAFAAPKIVTPDIALGGQMTLDTEGTFYHPTSAYSIVSKGVYYAPEKFLLGLLNSKLTWFYLTQKGGVLRGGYFRFFPMFLEPLPLPAAPSATVQGLVERLVDYQLHLKSGAVSSSLATLMATGFSRLMDGLIYELYFPEEFENRLRLSQLLLPENLPSLPLSDSSLEAVFKTHFAPTSDVRAVLFALEEIEAVRVIEAASPERIAAREIKKGNG